MGEVATTCQDQALYLGLTGELVRINLPGFPEGWPASPKKAAAKRSLRTERFATYPYGWEMELDGHSYF